MTVRLQQGRRTGVALLGFGATGIALLLAAAALLLGSLSTVDDAVTGFEGQRRELVALLVPASTALADAADATSRAGVSLTQGSDAAERAAGLAASLGSSFDGLATLGAFEVFGARPFAGLSDDFLSVGAEARALATSLAATAGSMRTNAGDTAAVAGHLRTLAAQLEVLATSTGGSSDSEGASADAISVARLVLVGLLGWLAMPAVAGTWLGWRMLRRGLA